ncbi:MAG: hypothetical protein JKY27_07555 [Magnetovibrio sp.]|nr:hypothetical protein [Magnetovibrio sp.]
MILTRITRVVSSMINRQAAAQFALFAMLLQAMIPLSAVVPVPDGDGTRQGQSIPNFYLVICTAFGAQSQSNALDGPLDKVPSGSAPWDCPVCLVQTSVQGPAPVTPEVAFIPRSLPLECNVPEASDLRVALWSAAPGRARAPPAA